MLDNRKCAAKLYTITSKHAILNRKSSIKLICQSTNHTIFQKIKRIMEATILLAWCAGGHGNMTHTPEAKCESNCNLRSLLEKN